MFYEQKEEYMDIENRYGTFSHEQGRAFYRIKQRSSLEEAQEILKCLDEYWNGLMAYNDLFEQANEYGVGLVEPNELCDRYKFTRPRCFIYFKKLSDAGYLKIKQHNPSLRYEYQIYRLIRTYS